MTQDEPAALLEQLRRALAKSGIQPPKARGVLDALYVHGPGGLADPADRAIWTGIFGDARRMQRLVEEVRTADAARVRHALEARRAARARGLLPPVWRPPRTAAFTEMPVAADIVLPPWLEAEAETASAVCALVVALAAAHPLVAAVVLYGSMARGDARPLNAPAAPAALAAPDDAEAAADSELSDVDLLVLVQVPVQRQDQQGKEMAHSTPIPEDIHRAVWQAERVVGEAQVRPAGQHAQRARELHVLASPWDLAAHWDTLFVETVAEDGLVLWARCPLPIALAALADRAGLLN